MPTLSIGTKKEIDVPAFVLTLRSLQTKDKIRIVGIETQHAMPKQGVSSMFKIGKGYGIIIGALAALELPYTEIRANDWQKIMFVGHPKSNTKDISKKIAKQLYPKCEFKASLRCTTMHDGMTDACMIANFAKLKHQ
jgi:crossover junction endodeoxyribonuclease RuvC